MRVGEYRSVVGDSCAHALIHSLCCLLYFLLYVLTSRRCALRRPARSVLFMPIVCMVLGYHSKCCKDLALEHIPLYKNAQHRCRQPLLSSPSHSPLVRQDRYHIIQQCAGLRTSSGSQSWIAVPLLLFSTTFSFMMAGKPTNQ